MQHRVATLLKRPDAFAGILQAVGVAAPHFMAWLANLTEYSVASRYLWAPLSRP
jgi:putative oxidoreductase